MVFMIYCTCQKTTEKEANVIKKQSLYIILSVMLLSLAVTFTDAFIKPDYTVKVLIKIVFFLLIPLSYFVVYRSEFANFKKLFAPKKRTMLRAVLFGGLIYIGIVGGYFLTRGFIDYSNVTNTLKENHGITKENFIYVSIYISLMNSFLEEFFFRGFGFIALKQHINRKIAYVFSPILFAVYHAGMMIGMFSPWVLVLLFIGLFAGGCIFNYLNESSENIYTSWICHMLINFAINTVGFLLFGLL